LKRFPHFDHNYDGSDINNVLQNTDPSDSLVYVQGFSGTNIEVDLSDIETYKDKHLNHAELEFYVAEEFQENREEADRLIAFFRDNDGEYIPTSDAVYQLQDGLLKENETNGLKRYKVILTSQLREFLDDPSLERKVFISIFGKNSVSNRSIIYGSNHSKYPMKLKAIFTES